MDNRKFKQPYKRRSPSRKDYDHFKTNGVLGAAQLPAFPHELLAISRLLTQTAQNCTAYTGIAIRESMTGKQYDPEMQWVEELKFMGVQDADGATLATQLAVGKEVGFTPVGETAPTDKATAYFWVNKASGFDWFDSARLAVLQLYQKYGKVIPLSIGVNWYQEWDNTPNGVIPDSSKVLLGGHDTKIAGFETFSIDGIDYIVLQGSWGAGYGDNGLFRVSRDVFNKWFDVYGIGYWVDDPDPQIERLGLFQALLQHLITLYQTLFAKEVGAITDLAFTPQINAFSAAIQSFEGYFAPCLRYPFGTAAYRNNNPGNLRFTPYSVSLGANGYSPAGFAKFPTYQAGYHALCQMLTDICSGKLHAYDPTKGLLAFFQVYAPSSDNNNPLRYASVVAARMGVSINTPIQTFLKVATT